MFPEKPLFEDDPLMEEDLPLKELHRFYDISDIDTRSYHDINETGTRGAKKRPLFRGEPVGKLQRAERQAHRLEQQLGGI